MAPRSGLVPRSPGQAARRRRVVLLALVGLALVTLAAGLLGPRILLLVHLLVDAALAAYAFLLRERVGRASRGAGLVALHDDDLDDSVLRRKAAGG